MLTSFSCTRILIWGIGVNVCHPRRPWLAQDPPVVVRDAGRPCIPQAVGEKQIESCCFRQVALERFLPCPKLRNTFYGMTGVCAYVYVCT